MDAYTILKIIGEGTFGQALLVQPKSSNEHYVMKQIRLPKGGSGIDKSRREAVLLSRMKHSNIVAFRESFEAEGHLHIVMEYCAGGDLLQRIKQQKGTPFTQDMILNWFAQMCLGAKYIHDQRVLHRDLKSKNIFLTNGKAIKLGDFGSACALNSSKAFAYTYVGTPYYVSPEIWDNKPYNNKSDVWSLGCVLYELCTLRHPFQASSWKALILKVCRGSYPPLPSHLPYELHYLVKHMFKANPRDRPSLHTILTSHRVTRLLKKHLPWQELEGEKPGKWKKDEGGKVTTFLANKSLLECSSVEDTGALERRQIAITMVHLPGKQDQFTAEETDLLILEVKMCDHVIDGSTTVPPKSTEPKQALESRSLSSVGEEQRRYPRKRWTGGPSETVLEVLRNADLTSSSSSSREPGTYRGESDSGQSETILRKQWDRRPPERLLSFLEKAHLSTAFKTFTVRRADGENPLVGPLWQAGQDDTDGDVEESVDEHRLEQRSDDEDTDFEEDLPYDWVGELERMVTGQ